MRQRLKAFLFGLLGKDPDAVVVSFWSGDDARARRMIDEVVTLIPDRRHYVVSLGLKPLPAGCEPIILSPASAGPLWLQLRRLLRRQRIGMAPVLFDGTPSPLRAAAAGLAPLGILAYNRNLERHHLQLRTAVASALFFSGLPLDRIWLRPTWLCPWKRDRTRVPDEHVTVEGRPLRPGRRKVAVLSPFFPYPFTHGGAVRIFHLLREAAEEFDLMLFAFAKDPGLQEFGPLQDFCSQVTVVAPPFYREPRWSTLAPPEAHEYNSPVMRRLLAAARFDLLQVEYTWMAGYGGDVLVAHDVTWDLYRQVLEREPGLGAWWNWIRWRLFEGRATRRYRSVVGMSAKDCRLLGLNTCRTIENGVDLDRFRAAPEPPGLELLFIGSFNHFPNVEAFRFFLAEVWPRLRDRFPEMQFTVVAGRNHLLYWRQFTGEPEITPDPRIAVHDFVRDVKPLYEESNIVIAPTPVSAGTNLKVLEAMAMERAIVSTSSGCAGLGLVHGVSVWISDGGAAFTEGVALLAGDPGLRTRLARAARLLAVERFGWKALGEKQRSLWHELIAQKQGQNGG